MNRMFRTESNQSQTFCAARTSAMDIDRGKLNRLLEAYMGEINNEADTESNKLISQENSHQSRHLREKPSDKYSIPVNKRSILFAVFNFLSSAGTGVLWSYISLYYKQLGFDAQEIGVLCSVQSLVAILYTPLIGCIADRFAVRRLLLSGSLIAASLSHFALNFVPKVRSIDCTSLALCANQSTEEQKIVTKKDFTISDELSSIIDQPQQYEQISLSLTESLIVCHKDKTDTGYWYNSDDLRIVFMYLVLVNIVCQVVTAPWNPLSIAVLLKELGVERRHQYAYFRGIGGLGIAFGTLVGGLLLDFTILQFTHCGIEENRTNFMVCFGSFSFLLMVSSPVAWLMSGNESSEQRQRQCKEKTKHYDSLTVIRALCSLRYGSVVLTITCLAVVTGKMRAFDFWYMKILGGSYTLIGFGGFVSRFSMMGVFFCLPVLNKKFGHIPLLVIACLGCGAGCAISAYATQVEWMLIPVFLRDMTIAIFQQASGAFLADAVDPRHLATLQSLMAALMFGVGKGVGSILGGGLIKELSVEMSYFILGVASVSMAVILILAQVAHRYIQ